MRWSTLGTYNGRLTSLHGLQTMHSADLHQLPGACVGTPKTKYSGITLWNAS